MRRPEKPPTHRRYAEPWENTGFKSCGICIGKPTLVGSTVALLSELEIDRYHKSTCDIFQLEVLISDINLKFETHVVLINQSRSVADHASGTVVGVITSTDRPVHVNQSRPEPILPRRQMAYGL